ncbi:adenine nucleotide alpha hydrolase [Rhizobium leguminosarum]|uniref:adenine nucleotide alpha hydrolase n=1 Tax=Rhizobium leguminosarum TaxID=384 RepID=UPI001C91516F|nr:adenine nucleotide alpha hydrolase [Rhizobium leguminosarum]MBY3031755.1 adenine nucleotide alpha hydrolase [Rhizobium leguminosarum]
MRKALEECLASLGDVSIAVSGGVDSLTLAVIATRLLGPARVEIMHAISAAVPREATERVEMLARSEGFDLTIIDAGEFSDPDYLRNPVNRCFFCKGNLYGAIAARSSRQVLSGTNLDDLGEYRPGLEAAKNFAVRHPFVEAGIGKQGVRQLARDAGLGALSEISASPCLSSRIETSIAIQPEMLAAVHRIETFLTETLKPQTVRCRVRRSGVAIELDREALARARGMTDVGRDLRGMLPGAYKNGPLTFEPYRNGSAFVGVRP